MGESDEVLLIQVDVGPVNTMVGMALTLTKSRRIDTQPGSCEVSTKAV